MGAAEMKPFVENLHKCVDTYLYCYPNAGVPNESGAYDDTPDKLAADLEPFFAEGILNAVGGCSGTTPDHIVALKNAAGKHGKR